MEGGGDQRGSKETLRLGMDSFLAPLKAKARGKSLSWKLRACGGRNAAYDRFRNAVYSGEHKIAVLLVDAEGPVQGTPREHLKERDQWEFDFSADTDNELIHLMVQTMEAWIVADERALAKYYGAELVINALPKSQNLESVRKQDIASKLKQATRRTQKGEYDKIYHAKNLLERIDVNLVQQRCPSCKHMFETLSAAIENVA